MWIMGFLLAGAVAALGVTVALPLRSPASAAGRLALGGGLGAVIGVPLGVFMGNINPPQYDWFGIYPLGQLVMGVLGGLAGGAAAAIIGRRPQASGAAHTALPETQLSDVHAGQGGLPLGQAASARLPRAAARRAAVSISVLGLVLASLTAYRYINPTRPPAYTLPEVEDALVHPQQLVEGMSMDEARAALGEPSLMARDEDYSSWYYGVRRTSRIKGGSVRAPVLKVTVDTSGHVQSWGFAHPVTGRPLELREGRLQATRWLNAVCGSGDGPRVALEERLVPGVTTSDEVLAMFGSWSLQPWTFEHRQEIFARPLPDGGKVLIYPVDHPSAMYLPVNYIELSFDRSDRLRVWSYSGGC